MYFKNIKYLEKIDSTNSYLKDRIDLFVDNSVVFAKSQSQGRGRFQRNWLSGEGSSILASFLLHSYTPINAIQATFLFSLGVRAFLLNYLDKEYACMLKLKWPNDLLLGSRKICGVLSEFHNDSLIVGVGINIFDFKIEDGNLKKKIITLAECSRTVKKYSLRNLQESFLNEIEKVFLIYNLHNPSTFLGKWFKLSSLEGKKVSILQGNDSILEKKVNGSVVGLSEYGELIVKLENQEEKVKISHGDISIND